MRTITAGAGAVRLSPDTIASIHRPGARGPARLPLFSARIPAGFPSPADDYVDGGSDLNEFLVRHPAATFFVRVSGDSMTGAGIHSGDMLVVDRAVTARNRQRHHRGPERRAHGEAPASAKAGGSAWCRRIRTTRPWR